jgi:DNA invertase Pin-like site-specific DNA recombinase
MDVQRSAVERYAAAVGAEIIESFTEVESGKRCDRPQLALAIAAAKRTGARLAIAKLDRLGRNVHFITGLMEQKVDFFAVDSPGDGAMILQIKAAVAEEEARKISQRTRDALAEAKKRGVLLGSARPGAWAGREDVRLAALVKARAARAANRKLKAQMGGNGAVK